MSLTSAEAEAKDFVGSTVETPDGIGEVTAVGDRYVVVKLSDGRFSEFPHRDVTLKAKPKLAPAPTPINPVDPPVPPAAEAPAETPA